MRPLTLSRILALRIYLTSVPADVTRAIAPVILPAIYPCVARNATSPVALALPLDQQ